MPLAPPPWNSCGRRRRCQWRLLPPREPARTHEWPSLCPFRGLHRCRYGPRHSISRPNLSRLLSRLVSVLVTAPESLNPTPLLRLIRDGQVTVVYGKQGHLCQPFPTLSEKELRAEWWRQRQRLILMLTEERPGEHAVLRHLPGRLRTLCELEQVLERPSLSREMCLPPWPEAISRVPASVA